MSDAKAKAEARRAKILARDSSKRTVSAILEIDAEETPKLNLAIGPTTPKERPLAARRSFIRQTVKTAESADVSEREEVGEAAAAEGLSSSVGVSGGEVNGSDAMMKTESEDVSTKDAKLSLPPKKSLEEVEREVAEHTQKFDSNMTSTSSTKIKKATKTADTPDTPAAAAADTQVPVLSKKKSNVDGGSIMRLVRMVMILLLAGYTGFRVVQQSKQDALVANTSVNMAFDEFNPSSSLPHTHAHTHTQTSAEGRTWLQYAQQRLVGQTESSVTAVSLMYYLSRLLSPALTAPLPKKKAEKPLEYIMNLLTNGVSNILEGVYTTLGEVCLHMVMIWVTVCLLTLHFQQQLLEGGAVGAPEESKGVEL